MAFDGTDWGYDFQSNRLYRSGVYLGPMKELSPSSSLTFTYQAETVLVVKQDQSKINDYAFTNRPQLGAQLGTVQVDFANEASGDE